MVDINGYMLSEFISTDLPMICKACKKFLNLKHLNDKIRNVCRDMLDGVNKDEHNESSNHIGPQRAQNAEDNIKAKLPAIDMHARTGNTIANPSNQQLSPPCRNPTKTESMNTELYKVECDSRSDQSHTEEAEFIFSVCHYTTRRGCALECIFCAIWLHTECEGLKDNEVDEYQSDLEKQYKCSLCCHSELQAQPKDDSAKLKDVAYAVHNAEIYIASENEESMERALDNTHETVVGAANDQTYTKVLVGVESDKIEHDVIVVRT
jgi:hypothetical protein